MFKNYLPLLTALIVALCIAHATAQPAAPTTDTPVQPPVQPPVQEWAGRVSQRLSEDAYLSRYTLGVQLHRDVLYLYGTVDNAFARDRATRLANWVPNAGVISGAAALTVVNDIEIDGARPTDRRLEQTIRERLKLHTASAGSELDVSVFSGSVVLSGEIRSTRAKTLAAELVGSIVGVRRLHNRVTVSIAQLQAETNAVRTSAVVDLSIPSVDRAYASLVNGIANDPLVDATDLTAEVSDTLATLSGTVPTLFEKNRAGNLAAATVGIDEVENVLLVAKRPPLDYAPIAGRVKKLLQDDPFIDATNLDVVAADGQFTLLGNVESGFQRARAEQLVADLLAVRSVQNRLLAGTKPAPDFSDYVAKTGDRELLAFAPLALRSATKSAGGANEVSPLVAHLRHNLQSFSQFDVSGIEIKGNDEVVTLQGSVESEAARKEAIRIALGAGAQRVMNRLQVLQ